jgi:hypothetical protein
MSFNICANTAIAFFMVNVFECVSVVVVEEWDFEGHDELNRGAGCYPIVSNYVLFADI